MSAITSPAASRDRSHLALAHLLALGAALLAVVVSLLGVTTGLYNDNAWTAAAWKGNDLATVAVAGALSWAVLRRGSLRVLLVELGLLAYLGYNYAFYLFGAVFNEAFLLYVAIVVLSGWSGGLLLTGLNVEELKGRFADGRWRKPVAAYTAFLGVGLAGAWVIQSLAFVLADTVPSIIVNTEHPTSVVFALDLAWVVPLSILGGILLWRRRAWGYLLAAVMAVKGVGYGAALLAMSIYSAYAGQPDAWGFAPFSALFLAGGLACVWALFGNFRPEKPEGGQ